VENAAKDNISRPRIVVLAGARPNFIKVAPILRELARYKNVFDVQLVHTGQHYDETMSAVFWSDLGIPAPDAHLGVGSGPHGVQTARVLEALENYLLGPAKAPAGVVVVGDVNSTMAGALAAVKLRIPVAHVEAGLRSFDRTMPEEINRVVTDAVSDLLLVSEKSGLENLEREGIDVRKIRFVGNVMIDTLVLEMAASDGLHMAESVGLEPGGYAYVTLHRPSNVDSAGKLARIMDFLNWVSERLPVVFPVHPRTKTRLDEFDLRQRNNENLNMLEPLGYRQSLSFMKAARLVLTDSGGVQEETSFLRVPCLTLRPNTERPVTVSDGTNTVVGNDLSHARSLVEDILAGRYKAGGDIDGWDGRAAVRIVDALAEVWARTF
jgi:UDP-N-acetylglucosamine 2-epimerase (non-hydrolysing)